MSDCLMFDFYRCECQYEAPLLCLLVSNILFGQVQGQVQGQD